MSKPRYKLPTKKQIVNYWQNNMQNFGPQMWLDEQGCFACNNVKKIERAHIEPYCKTQNNSVDNLHLLYGSCHLESENLGVIKYWKWLKYKRVNEWKPLYEHAFDHAHKCGFYIRDWIKRTEIGKLNPQELNLFNNQVKDYFNDDNLGQLVIKEMEAFQNAC